MSRRADPIVVQLRAARVEAGRTQRDVAAAAGLTGTTVSGCENGRYGPNLVTLRQWSAALGFELTLTPAGPTTEDGDA